MLDANNSSFSSSSYRLPRWMKGLHSSMVSKSKTCSRWQCCFTMLLHTLPIRHTTQIMRRRALRLCVACAFTFHASLRLVMHDITISRLRAAHDRPMHTYRLAQIQPKKLQTQRRHNYTSRKSLACALLSGSRNMDTTQGSRLISTVNLNRC